MTNKQHLELLIKNIAELTGDATTYEQAKDGGHERYLALDEICGQAPGFRLVTIMVNSGATRSAFGFGETSNRLPYKEMRLRLEGILAGLPVVTHHEHKLLDNTYIPAMVKTNERIFQIETYNGENVLCNLETAQRLINKALCKRIKHYWNNKFTAIGKLEVKQMPS